MPVRQHDVQAGLAMDVYELWNGIEEDRTALKEANRNNLALGRKAAVAEAEYQRAKAARVWQLAEEGRPASFIALVIKGDQGVNPYMLKRDVAQYEYENSKEEINGLKLSIRVQNDQMAREWGQSR